MSKGVRHQISPLISSLIDEGIINWYHFLIHNKNSGVPTSDDGMYFHIRLGLNKEMSPEELIAKLPDYCSLTRKIQRYEVEKITGIDEFIIKNEKIEEAWRIIGEQSEWVINMLKIHKEDVQVPNTQIAQFLHFFANMCQMQVR